MPIVQLTMKARLQGPGVEVRNVFYISGVDVGAAQATGTIAALRTAYQQHLAPHLHTGFKLYGASWRNVSVPGFGGVDVAFEEVSGQHFNTEMLPPQVAALVSFKTGTQRPNQSRKYLAGMPEGAQDGGRWLATPLTAMQAWGDAVAAIGGGAGSDRPIGVAKIDPATGLALDWNPYSVAIAREITATMRSRRIGQGI